MFSETKRNIYGNPVAELTNDTKPAPGAVRSKSCRWPGFEVCYKLDDGSTTARFLNFSAILYELIDVNGRPMIGLSIDNEENFRANHYNFGYTAKLKMGANPNSVIPLVSENRPLRRSGHDALDPHNEPFKLFQSPQAQLYDSITQIELCLTSSMGATQDKI